jgi:hypothetical protein
MSPPDVDELDTRESEARELKSRQDEWNHCEPYTGWDFLQESLRQQREMEAARRKWLAGFLADIKRVEEWKIT